MKCLQSRRSIILDRILKWETQRELLLSLIKSNTLSIVDFEKVEAHFWRISRLIERMFKLYRKKTDRQ